MSSVCFTRLPPASILAWFEEEKKGAFYKTTKIQDRGFNKWMEAADTAFKVIKWVGLVW